MTVCIASLCCSENGIPKKLVVASDRMVTLGNFMEFEHEVSKISILNKSSVVLVAGDTLRGSKIVDLAKIKISENVELTKTADIANIVAQVYSECRDECLENELFKPKGFTRKEFYESYQTKLLPQLAFQLDQTVSTFDYGVQLIVAGVDDIGSHAYTIANPGNTAIDVHQISYTSIGSGGLHATQALIGFGHSGVQDLNKTIFCTFAAKKRAEVAPGVGRDTDLFVITDSGIKELSRDEINILEEIYQEAYHKPLAESVESKLNKLDFIKPTENDK